MMYANLMWDSNLKREAWCNHDQSVFNLFQMDLIDHFLVLYYVQRTDYILIATCNWAKSWSKSIGKHYS
jgi:hypothetical protein